MQLLVIRHAIAMEREEYARTGRPDSDRPLTDTGRRRMRKNARGLQYILEDTTFAEPTRVRGRSGGS